MIKTNTRRGEQTLNMAALTLRRSAAALAALLVLGPMPAPGQSLPDLDDEWRWVDFGPESGVPAGVVRDIVEVDTLIWVRTDSAAAWYDGFQWITPPTLAAVTGPTTSLAPDSAGGVILVQGGRIYRGDVEGFEQVALSGLNASGGVVRAVPYRDGGMLVTTSGNPARLWAVRGGRAVLQEALPAILDPTSLTLTRAGRAWIDTSAGLHVLRGERWVDRIPGDAGHDVGSSVTENSSLQGFIHRGVSTLDGGMLRFQGEGPPTPVREEAGNVLWAGDVGEDGLAIMAYETGDLRAYAGGAWQAFDLPSARRAGIQAVRIAGNGDLWFGTNRGLHLYRRSAERFSVIRMPFPSTRNRIHAILQDSRGAMWLATGGGVLRHTPGGRGDWFSDLDGIFAPSATGLAEAADGSIWLTSGGDFEGALRWDGSSWTRFDAENGLPVGHVHRVFTDAEGALWFASLGNGDDIAPGMYRWHEDRLVPGTDMGLPESRAYAFTEGPDGTKWFAFAGGLYRMLGDSVRAWTDFSDMGIGTPLVWDVALDGRGRPWIAFQPTMALGLAFLDEDGDFRPVRVPGPEGVRRVWSLLFEDDGALWLGTEGGVLLLRSGVWAHFDESTGLPTVNVWPIAVQEEAILVGTKGGGVVEINRSEADDPAPRVVIQNVTPEGRSLWFSYSALAFQGSLPSDVVRTRYRIDGSEWSPWGTEREHLVPGLSPGDHTVEVQAHGLYAQLSEPTAESFRIEPPLFLRPAVGIPVGGLALALLILGSSTAVRRRRHERELRLSEQRLRTVLDHAPEAIGILDVEANRFIDANRKALTMLKVDPEDLTHVDPATLTPARLQEGGARPLWNHVQAALEGEAPVIDWIAVATDGTEIPCEVRWVRLPSADRQLVRVSMVDTRERLEAETRRQELEAQLRQSQKLEAVGQLSGGIAHDFNNLLTVIRGNLEIMSEDLPPGGAEADLVGGALDAVMRSTELSQRLLAIGRRQNLDARPVDVARLLHSMEDLLRRSLGERVELVVEPAQDLWHAFADAGQLESAILNLAINARDAMTRGGRLTIGAENLSRDRPRAVALRDVEPGDYVVISVKDTGTGMSEELAAQAFNPFFTTKEVGKGSGLGLSMVHGFATQSGGSARIQSKPGVGTCVEVILPRAGVDAAGAADDPVDGESVSGRGERVLVVEDDAGVVKLLDSLLGHLGYETLSARDGQEALLELEGGEAVDALLIDLVLPGTMDGAELARRVRSLNPGIPVLFMSGYGEEALTTFSDDPSLKGTIILRKPFDQNDLARQIRKALDR